MRSTVKRVTKVWREETQAEKRKTFQKYPSSTTVSDRMTLELSISQWKIECHHDRQSGGDPFDPVGEGVQPALLQQ